MKVRIANNKNIQTMEQKDIDIYEILKGVEYGTELYTPMCGNVVFTFLPSNNETIRTEKDLRIYRFDKNGRWMEGGEVMLFPSNEMRDWSKFFKKGDVLICYEGKKPYYTIFDGFEDNTYRAFKGKFAHDCYEDKWYQNEGNLSTNTFQKLNRADSEIYVTKIEERFGGKLNRETLEIEKPAKLTFEVGKLYVFNEDDEDGELTIIGKLIDKNESEDTLTFGNQYEIENEKFVTDQAFDLRISVNKELREATENEVELFNKHYAIWKKEKEAKEHRAFKPFDKVLVRSGDNCKWLPALFIRDRGVGFESRHTALPIHSGEPASFAQCISYDGNEYLAFTSDPF
nr:MAG: hypothetical protein [Bacteriophage sp.]